MPTHLHHASAHSGVERPHAHPVWLIIALMLLLMLALLAPRPIAGKPHTSPATQAGQVTHDQ